MIDFLFSIIRFIRPLNLFLGILTCIIVSYKLDFNSYKQLFDICVVLLCYMVAGNMLNDVVDINIDRINKPNRFLIRYPINKIFIIVIIIIIFSLGSFIVLRLSILAQQLTFLFILPLMILYELYFKRQPLVGNIFISLLVGSVFIFTDASLNNSISTTWPIFILAFFLNLIREIIKDMQDIRGDKKYNYHTLPISMGVSPTITILRILTITFIIISLSPLYTDSYSLYYIPLILFSIHIPLLYIMWKLRINITTKECDHFSKLLKAMIINGIIIILLTS